MNTKSSSSLEELQSALSAAKRAVAALIASPIGQAFAEAREAAYDAMIAVVDISRQALFPSIWKPSAELIARFNFATELVRHDRYREEIESLHCDALQHDPELAEFLRSRAVVARITAFAASRAMVLQRSEDELIQEAAEQYERAIACQLVDDPQLGPFARTLAIEAPKLWAEIHGYEAAQAAHRQTELDRQAQEQRDADAAVAAEEQRRRDEVAAFFAARQSLIVQVGARLFTGGAVAKIARRELAYDINGQPSGLKDSYQPPSLAELELAMRKAAAAEQVTV